MQTMALITTDRPMIRTKCQCEDQIQRGEIFQSAVGSFIHFHWHHSRASHVTSVVFQRGTGKVMNALRKTLRLKALVATLMREVSVSGCRIRSWT